MGGWCRYLQIFLQTLFYHARTTPTKVFCQKGPFNSSFFYRPVVSRSGRPFISLGASLFTPDISPKSLLSARALTPKLNQKKEVRTSDIHEHRGVPNNYALHVLAVIYYYCKSLDYTNYINIYTYTILRIIILLAFWQSTSCPQHPQSRRVAIKKIATRKARRLTSS